MTEKKEMKWHPYPEEQPPSLMREYLITSGFEVYISEYACWSGIGWGFLQ